MGCLQAPLGLPSPRSSLALAPHLPRAASLRAVPPFSLRSPLRAALTESRGYKARPRTATLSRHRSPPLVPQKPPNVFINSPFLLPFPCMFAVTARLSLLPLSSPRALSPVVPNDQLMVKENVVCGLLYQQKCTDFWLSSFASSLEILTEANLPETWTIRTEYLAQSDYSRD